MVVCKCNTSPWDPVSKMERKGGREGEKEGEREGWREGERQEGSWESAGQSAYTYYLLAVTLLSHHPFRPLSPYLKNNVFPVSIISFGH